MIENNERARNHEHHFRQPEVVARMNRCFRLEKSDHVVADEADCAALKMGDIIARNKAEFAEDFLQFAEGIGGAAIGGGKRFFANR